MSKTFKIVNGDISDGYHTFDELYDHRCLLYVGLCLMTPEACVYKDDPAFGDWFCLYAETDYGQISYHLPRKYLYLIEGKITKDDTHKWDGHTSEIVIKRLVAMAESYKP